VDFHICAGGGADAGVNPGFARLDFGHDFALRPSIVRFAAVGCCGILGVAAGGLAVFVSGVLVWAYRADQWEQQIRRDTLIADALSAEAQLRAQLESEKDALSRLVAELKGAPRTAQSLLAAGEVSQACAGSGSA